MKQPGQDKPKLSVVFCWHMHQPDYRNQRNGEYQLPWTYLHAIKDYVDMVALLENNPLARVVINFSPVLLEQIDDYSQQIQRYFTNNTVVKDHLLNALVDPTLSSNPGHRRAIIKSCMRANEQHLVNRFEPYQRLVRMGRWLDNYPDEIGYLNGQYFVDLLIWYHLVWLGETVRHSNPRVKELMKKGSGYTFHDRRELLAIIGDLLKNLLERYRILLENGQIELSLSPYSHPIIPLLIDIKCAREAMPDIVLPVIESYPGGVERARWQIEKGLETFEHYFGVKPGGCWLSEGGLSEAGIGLLDDCGFQWTAGGESVLHNSLREEKSAQENWLYKPYQFSGNATACFFRDDELSDLIGFTYSEWHGDDAVSNLVHRLELIDQRLDGQEGAVVSVILDGENAWEHYPENGYHFLQGLYQSLSNHQRLELQTFSDCLKKSSAVERTELKRLVAGSWVYGTFSTWIGDEYKNRAWEMLTDAKQCFDTVVSSREFNEQQLERAQRQLAICESSDWFWWFGDYNPADTVSDFDGMFRMHLANLYQCLGMEPPTYLSEEFTHGGGQPLHGGAMRQGRE